MKGYNKTAVVYDDDGVTDFTVQDCLGRTVIDMNPGLGMFQLEVQQ